MNTLRQTAFLTATTVAFALAGCGDGTAPAPADTGTASEQAPDARPGIVASDARLVLPAVAGRPGAAYFTVRNTGTATATLVAAHVQGAGKTEMHRTEGGSMSAVDRLEVVPSGALTFAPGNLHAMVFDLDPALKPGGKSELTLTFSDGDKVSIPLAVETMGQMHEGMEGHDMDDMEGMQH